LRQCVIIANKGAGSFSPKFFDRICSSLETGGLAVEHKFCSDFAEMTATAAASSHSNSPLIVAAGGDGTINAVFNGLAGNNATCAILPMGTANVMAIELGIKSPEQAVSRIISGQSRPFTAGLIKNRDRSNRFFLMAGAGFDGHIVRGVSLSEKRLLGKGAYLLSALRSLVSWDKSELHVTTEAEEFSCSSLIVCNAARYGGSFLLAPSANIFSPFFEIVAIKGNSRNSSLRAVAEAVLGFGNSGQIIRTTAKTISIEGCKPVQADGDHWGDGPTEILAEPDYARIIV
jgi:YegS/Rv2252/BmrU family lipid kinase